MQAPRTQTCKRCNAVFSAYTERCPNCGRDDAHGSQLGGVLITVGFLMILVPAVIILIVVFT